MSEQVNRCPVAQTDSNEVTTSSSRFNLVTSAAQRHINEPGHHDEINADLSLQLESKLDLMFQSRPEHARHRVVRGVRAATFAAFFHIAAEPIAQGEQPQKDEDWVGHLFSHTEYTTEPTRHFAQRVSVSMLDRFQSTNNAMFDPDNPLSVYQGLASSLRHVLTDFNTVTPTTDLHPSYRTDLENWFTLAAEDNAASELDVLISAGNACRKLQPEASAKDMAAFALSNMNTLIDVASVNMHTSATISVREELPSPGFDFGRKNTVVEYEVALAQDRPVEITSGVLHVEPTINWGASLKSGPWREPGHCAAYPELSSHFVPGLSFRTIATELEAAVTVAEDTIYAHWPQ